MREITARPSGYTVEQLERDLRNEALDSPVRIVVRARDGSEKEYVLDELTYRVGEHLGLSRVQLVATGSPLAEPVKPRPSDTPFTDSVRASIAADAHESHDDASLHPDCPLCHRQPEVTPEVIAAVAVKVPAAKVDKTPTHGVKVGDIFSHSWGYSMIIADFYQVKRLVGKTQVIVQKIAQETTPTGYLRGTAVPVPGQFIEREHEQDKGELRKTVKTLKDGKTYLNMGSGWCELWDGKPEQFDHCD